MQTCTNPDFQISYSPLYIQRSSYDSEATPPLSEEEQLLLAVRLKAEAFANKEWLQYWNTNGPSLLATGWVTAHPHIPLQTLQDSVHTLEFLTSTMEHLGLSSTSSSGTSCLHQSNGIESELLPPSPVNCPHGEGDAEGCSLQMGEKEEIAAVCGEALSAQELVNGDEQVVAGAVVQREFDRLKHEVSENVLEAGTTENGMENSHVSTGVDEAGECDGCHTNGIPSTDELLQLWEAHYNSYYWYAFQTFKEQAGELEVLYQAEPDVVKEGEDPSEEVGGNKEKDDKMEEGYDGSEVGGVEGVGGMAGDSVDQEESVHSNSTPENGEDLVSSTDKAVSEKEMESKYTLSEEINGGERTEEGEDLSCEVGSGPVVEMMVGEEGGGVPEGEGGGTEVESGSGCVAEGHFQKLLMQEEEDELRWVII